MSQPWQYRIIRSNRKTIALEITSSGQLLVRCPHRASQAEIRRFAESKSPWIRKQLARLAANPPLPPLTPAQLKELVDQAKSAIPQRVAHFAPIVGVSYGRITIRSQHTRWGSCSGRGNLNFNCLLMLAPPEVLDYVVVHELCHRLEMNHSPGFWDHVARILPDYRVPRAWLKTNGVQLIARLPAEPGNPA